MKLTISRENILAAVGFAALLTASCFWSNATCQAQSPPCPRYSTSGDLFYNYYVPPTGCNGVGAELYLCPRPTPPLVGHTWVTYPPLMPNEFLYQHHRVYKTWHDDAPMTRTSVQWSGRGTGIGWFMLPRFTLTPGH
jgi:hypothetical protein